MLVCFGPRGLSPHAGLVLNRTRGVGWTVGGWVPGGGSDVDQVPPGATKPCGGLIGLQCLHLGAPGLVQGGRGGPSFRAHVGLEVGPEEPTVA